MTRKDYKAIAVVIQNLDQDAFYFCGTRQLEQESVAMVFAQRFAQMYKNFGPEKFLKATQHTGGNYAKPDD